MNESTTSDGKLKPRAKPIPVVEMFGPTIQGEGAMIGMQTYFIRFGLCDYKCKMCDSMHAVDPNQVRQNAKWLTQDQVFEEFMTLYATGSAKTVTFSGGNPAIHDLQDLVDSLKEEGFRIVVETQGTFHPSWLGGVDGVTISPKGPGMGEKLEMDKLDAFIEDLYNMGSAPLNLKVVIFDERDLEVARMMYERYTKILGIPLFLSLGNPYPPGLDEDVVNGSMDLVEELASRYRMLFDEIKTDPILSNAIFTPQLHVFIWGNAKGK